MKFYNIDARVGEHLIASLNHREHRGRLFSCLSEFPPRPDESNEQAAWGKDVTVKLKKVLNIAGSGPKRSVKRAKTDSSSAETSTISEAATRASEADLVDLTDD